MFYQLLALEMVESNANALTTYMRAVSGSAHVSALQQVNHGNPINKGRKATGFIQWR